MGKLHFCKPCKEALYKPHRCDHRCEKYEECQKLCECGATHENTQEGK